MTSQIYHVKFNYEDYLLFPDDGKRHELIDGECYVSAAPSTKHQRVSRNILYLLHTYLRGTKEGEVLDAPTDVVLSDFDVVEPDLLYVSAIRAAIITAKHIRGAPDLVVEIISEITRKTDEVIKRKLYERYGISEYWVVDPELEMIKIYRLRNQSYVREAELVMETGDTLTTPLLPELKLPLAEIFE